jgi:hypothetical protein
LQWLSKANFKCKLCPRNWTLTSALIPVPPSRAVTAALMKASADDAFHIGLYDQVQDGLGNAA